MTDHRPPAPLLFREFDESDRLTLVTELPRLDEDATAELWWWVRRRGNVDYPPAPPDTEWTVAPALTMVDWMARRDARLQQSDWALCWYFLSLREELDEREQGLLSSPTNASVALVGLEPLPAWFAATRLGQIFAAFGV